MRTLRFDSTGGASGDMILAALIDAGADATSLKTQLASLDIGEFYIVSEPASDHAFHGTRVTVSYPHHDRHPHRHLNDIEGLIDGSDLPEDVKLKSKQVFQRLAAAEARVHGTTPDEVAFHEVGAVDSIVDVVGSCLAMQMLNIESVDVSPLPVGRGTIEGAHGTMPVPVPATVELLKNHEISQTDEPFELVTPTGAALLMEWKETGGPFDAAQGKRTTDEPYTPVGVGYGFGHRKLNARPNMLRATVLEYQDPSQSSQDSHPSSRAESRDLKQPGICLVLECNLDDTIPELLGSLTQKLMSQGALDVFTTPVQMKKQRPGTLLTVLCDPTTRDTMVDTIFAESTTFGIREYLTHRTMLDRRHIEVETPYGKVRVKIGTWKGKDITHAPEHDDCVKCAEEHDVPIRSVYEAALRAL